MKKLFYIVLVIVALMVISRFIKEHNPSQPVPTAVQEETSEPITATLPDTDCICDSEPACTPGEEGCDENALKSTCNCRQADGQTVTIEETVEEVEEINPAETAGDDETIINDEAEPTAKQ